MTQQHPLIKLVNSTSLVSQILVGLVFGILLAMFIPEWAKAGRVLVSGFHSPLERQVLRSLLRRQGRAVKVLARHLLPDRDYRPAAEEREPLAQGRLLIVSASPATETRTTRASALARNGLVLVLAREHWAPRIAPESPLTALRADDVV